MKHSDLRRHISGHRGRPALVVVAVDDGGCRIEWPSVKAAAAVLGCHPQHLRRFIRTGDPYKGYLFDYLPDSQLPLF